MKHRTFPLCIPRDAKSRSAPKSCALSSSIIQHLRCSRIYILIYPHALVLVLTLGTSFGARFCISAAVRQKAENKGDSVVLCTRMIPLLISRFVELYRFKLGKGRIVSLYYAQWHTCKFPETHMLKLEW